MFPSRHLLPVSCLIVCLGGCKESKPDSTSAKNTAVSAETSGAPIPASTLPTNDRGRLVPLTQKVLGFMRNKDTEALVLMAAPDARSKMSSSLRPGEAMHEKLFANEGWGWKTIDTWDEKVHDVRVLGDEARAKFAEVDGKQAAVVVFRKTDGVWYFEGTDNPALDAYASWGKPAE